MLVNSVVLVHFLQHFSGFSCYSINCISFIFFLMQWGMTSLMFASKEGHLDVVMHLLKDKNLDVNAQEDVSFQDYYSGCCYYCVMLC